MWHSVSSIQSVNLRDGNIQPRDKNPYQKDKITTKTPNKFKVGDTVRLDRKLFRGQFKPCKGRVGRIKTSLRLKSPFTSYRAIAIYEIEGLHPTRLLRLLGEDLIRVEEDTWIIQNLQEKLAS